MRFSRSILPLLAALVCLLTAFLPVSAQKLSDFDKGRGRTMLSTIKEDLKKNYYDPSFHGVDIETRFQEADSTIKQATSLGQVFWGHRHVPDAT